MPKPNRLPKYRHYKPKDLAVVRIDGRDVYLGRYGSPESHEKYGRVIAEWIATGTPPAPAAGTDHDATPTVSQIILAFLRHAEQHYRRADGTPTNEYENYVRTVRPLRKLYGGIQAHEFGPKALKAVRVAMIGQGLARKTINQRVGRIVRLFKWAVENELVQPAVHHGLKAVQGLRKGRSAARERPAIKPAPEALVEAVRPHVARQVWAMIQLQRLTGMRPGEVCQMRTCDLETSGRVWVYTPATHKTEHHDKERKVYLGPRAQAVLRPWLRTELMAYLFSPAEAVEEKRAARRGGRKTPMTPSHRSRKRKPRPKRAPRDRYDTRSYAHAVTAGCRQAFPHASLTERPKVPRKGLTADEREVLRQRLALTPEQRAELREWRRRHHWHPNQLRHNAATNLRREFGLDVARVILGHSSPAVTEVYAEVDREKALRVIEQVG